MTSLDSTASSTAGAEPDDAPGLGSSPIADTALAKAVGIYPFAADLWAEGLLWGTLVRSPHPHARIVRINTEPAFALPGVHAVVTAEDVPGDPLHGEHVPDRPVFADEVVRYHGEPVAAVAADHPDTARLAAAAVEVEYELLEPVTDPERSFHAAELHPDGNMIRHLPLRFGDPSVVGDVVVEGLYRIGRQDPAPVGVEAGLAVPRPDGGVELHVSSTDPHGDRDRAAACLGLEPERVRLVVAGVPGAAADREDAGMEVALGMLALRTARPVKMAFSREDSLLGHVHRHPAVLRYRHHADGEGRLLKVEAQLVLDGGAYAEASTEALTAMVGLAAGPYAVPHVFVDGWVMRTTNPPAGRVRGEGAVQACFGYEAQMDKLAAKLELDPAELRARNVLATGEVMPTGQTVTCPAPVGELLKAVMTEPLPAPPPSAGGPRGDGWDGSELLPGGTGGAADAMSVRRGIGYALGVVQLLGVEGEDEVSTATVRVLPAGDGGVECVVECAAVDTGSGFATLAAQIVQQELGVVRVRVTGADTDQPAAGPSARGRQTWVSGGAIERAAGMVRTQLLQPMAHELGMSVELLSLRDDCVVSYDGRHTRPIAEVLQGRELWASAQYRPHPTEPLDESGQGDAFAGLAFAAMRAVVDVDVELGSVHVVEVAVAQDVGRALNPRQVRARIEAGVAHGVGMALMEDLRVEGGRVADPSLGGYRLPTAMDVPDVRIAALVEERDVVAPFGAKGVGAVPVVVAPAAVAGAVRAATGRAVQRLPVRTYDAVERR